MKIINSLRSGEGKAAFPRMYVPFHSFYEEMLKRFESLVDTNYWKERERVFGGIFLRRGEKD